MTSSIWWILFLYLVVASESSMENPLQEEVAGWSVWTPCRADDGKTMSYRFRTCDDNDNPRQDADHEDCSGTILEVASRVCVPACETVIIQRLLDEEGNLQSYGGVDENVAQCLQMAAEQSIIEQESQNSSHPSVQNNRDHTTRSQNLTKSARNTTVTYQEFITGMLSLLNPVHTEQRSSTEEREILRQIRMLLAPLKQNAPAPQHIISKAIGNYATRYATGNQQYPKEFVNTQQSGHRMNSVERTRGPSRMANKNDQNQRLSNQRISSRPSTMTDPVVKLPDGHVQDAYTSSFTKKRPKNGPKGDTLESQLGGLLQALKKLRNHPVDMGAPDLSDGPPPLQRRRGRRDVDSIGTSPEQLHVEVNGSIFHRVGQLLRHRGQQIKGVFLRGMDTDFVGHLKRIGQAIRHFLSDRWSNFVETALPDLTTDANATDPITYKSQQQYSILDRLMGFLDIRNGFSDESGKSDVSAIGNNKKANSSLPDQPDDTFDMSTISETTSESDRNSIPFLSKPSDMVPNAIGNRKQSPSQNGSKVVIKKGDSSLIPPELPLNFSVVPELRKRVKREDIMVSSSAGPDIEENHSTDTSHTTADLNGIRDLLEKGQQGESNGMSAIVGFLQQLREFQSETPHLSLYSEVLRNLALFPKVQQLNHLRKVLNDLASFDMNIFLTFLTKLPGDVSLHLLQFAEQLRNLALSTDNLQHPDVLSSPIEILETLYEQSVSVNSLDNEVIEFLKEVIRTKITDHPRMMSRQRKVLKDIAFLITQVNTPRDVRMLYEKLLELSRITENQDHGNRLMEFLHDLTGIQSTVDIPWYRHLLDDLITPLQHQYKSHDLRTFVDRLFGSYKDIIEQNKDSGWIAFLKKAFQNYESHNLDLSRYEVFLRDVDTLKNNIHDHQDLDVLMGQLQFFTPLLSQSNPDSAVMPDTSTVFLHPEETINSTEDNLTEANSYQVEMLHSLKRRQIPPQHSKIRNFAFLNNWLDLNAGGKQKGNIAISEHPVATLFDMMQALRHKDEPVKNLLGMKRLHRLTSSLDSYQNMNYIRELLLTIDRFSPLEMRELLNGLKESKYIAAFLQKYLLGKFFKKYRHPLLSFLDAILHLTPNTPPSRNNNHLLELAILMSEFGYDHGVDEDSLHNVIRELQFVQTLAETYDFFSFLKLLRDDGISTDDVNSVQTLGTLMTRFISRGSSSASQTLGNIMRLVSWFLHHEKQNKTLYQSLMDIVKSLNNTSQREDIQMMQALSKNLQLLKEGSSVHKTLLDRFNQLMTFLFLHGKEIPKDEPTSDRKLALIDFLLKNNASRIPERDHQAVFSLARLMSTFQSNSYDVLTLQDFLQELSQLVRPEEKLSPHWNYLDAVLHLMPTNMFNGSKDLTILTYIMEHARYLHQKKNLRVLDRFLKALTSRQEDNVGVFNPYLQNMTFVDFLLLPESLSRKDLGKIQDLANFTGRIPAINTTDFLYMLQQMGELWTQLQETGNLKISPHPLIHLFQSLGDYVHFTDDVHELQNITSFTKHLKTISANSTIISDIANMLKYIFEDNYDQSVKENSKLHIIDALQTMMNNQLGLNDTLSTVWNEYGASLAQIIAQGASQRNDNTRDFDELLRILFHRKTLRDMTGKSDNLADIIGLLGKHGDEQLANGIKQDLETLNTFITERLNTISANSSIMSYIVNMLPYIFEGKYDQSGAESGKLKLLDALKIMTNSQLGLNDTSSTVWNEFGASLAHIMAEAASQRFANTGEVDELLRILFHQKAFQDITEQSDQLADIIGLLGTHGDEQLANGIKQDLEIMNGFSSHVQSNFSAVEALTKFLMELRALQLGALYRHGTYPHLTMSFMDSLLHIMQSNRSFDQGIANLQFLTKLIQDSKGRHYKSKFSVLAKFLKDLQMTPSLEHLDLYPANISYIDFLQLLDDGGFSEAEISAMQDLANLPNHLNNGNITNDFSNLVRLFSMLKSTIEKEENELQSYSLLDLFSNMRGSYIYNTIADIKELRRMLSLNRQLNAPVNDTVIKEIRNMIDSISSSHSLNIIQLFHFLRDAVRRGYYSTSTDMGMLQELSTLASKWKTMLTTSDVVSYENLLKNFHNTGSDQKYLATDENEALVHFLKSALGKDDWNAMKFIRLSQLADLLGNVSTATNTSETQRLMMDIWAEPLQQEDQDLRYLKFLSDMQSNRDIFSEEDLEELNQIVKTHADRFRQLRPHALYNLLGISDGSKDEQFISLIRLLTSHQVLNSLKSNDIRQMRNLGNIIRKLLPNLTDESVAEIMRLYRYHGSRDEHFMSLIRLLTSHQYLDSFKSNAILQVRNLGNITRRLLQYLTDEDVAEIMKLYTHHIGSDQKYLAKDGNEALVHFLKSALGKDDWNAVKFIQLSQLADLLGNVSTATNTSEIQRLMMDIWAEPLQQEDQDLRYLKFLSDMQSNRDIFSEEDLDELNQIVKTHADRLRQHRPYELHNLLGIIDGSRDEQFISLIRLLTSNQFLDSFRSSDKLEMQNLENAIRRLLPHLTDEGVTEIMRLYTHSSSRNELLISLMGLLSSQQFLDSFRFSDILKMRNLRNITRRLLQYLTDKDVAEIMKLYTHHIASDQKYLAKDENEALVHFLKSALGKDDWNAVKFIRLSQFANLLGNVSTATNTSGIQRLMMDIWAEPLQQEDQDRRYFEFLSDMRSNRDIFSEEDLEEFNQIVKTHADSFKQHGPYELHNLLGIIDGSRDEQFVSLIRLLTSNQFPDSFRSSDILEMKNLENIIRRLLPHLTDEGVTEIMRLCTHSGSRNELFISLMGLLSSQQFQDSFRFSDILKMRNLRNMIKRLLLYMTGDEVAEIMRLYTYHEANRETIGHYLRLMGHEGLTDVLAANRSLDMLRELKSFTKSLRSVGDGSLGHDDTVYDIQHLLSIFDTRIPDEGGDILHFISTLSDEPYRPTWPWSNSALHKMKLLSLNDHPPNGMEGDILSEIDGVFGQSQTGPHKPLMSLLEDVKDAADYKPSSIDAVAELDRHEKIKHWMKESTTALRSYLESITEVLGSDAQNNAASFLDLIGQTDIDMEAVKYSQAILDLSNLSRIVPNRVQTAGATTSIYEDALKLFGPGIPHTSLLFFVDALQEIFKQPDIDVSTDPLTLNKIGANLGSVPLAMTTTLDDIHEILMKTEKARSYLDFMQEILSSISGKETDMLPELKSLQDLENNGLLALLRTSSSSLVDKATFEHLDKLLGQKISQKMFSAGWEAVLQDDAMRNNINFNETTALLNNYQKDIFKAVAFKQYFGDLSDIVDILGQYSTLKRDIQKSGSNILDLLVDIQEFQNETFNRKLFQDMHTLQENMTGFGSNLENSIQLLASIFDLSPPNINAREVLLDAFTDIAIHSENITEKESVLLYRKITDNFQQPFKNAFADYLGNVSSLLWAKPEHESNMILLDMIKGLDWNTITKDNSALLYQQLAENFEEPLEPVFVESLGNISFLLWANPESETDELLLDMLQGIDWITNKSHEIKVVLKIFDEMRENPRSWNEAKQNATEILRMFTTLVVPSSNEITEQEKSDLFYLFEGKTHVSEDVSRNDTVTLYKLIHDNFREFPTNFSQETIEKFLSFLDTASREKLGDKFFLQLVGRLEGVKNDTRQMKLVRHLFQNMVSRVILQYNQTMSSIIKDLLLLHETRRISPVMDFILKIVRSNDTKIGNDQDNMRMFEDMMLHIPKGISFPEFFRYLDNIQELVDRESKNSDLLDLLNNVGLVSEEASRHDTIDLYHKINLYDFPSNISRRQIKELFAILNTAYRNYNSGKLFLRLVGKLSAIKNDRQMEEVRQLFRDMVSRTSLSYNQTMSRIIDDILLLREHGRIIPVVDFIQKIMTFNESEIGNNQDNIKLYNSINQQVPNGITFHEFTRYFADLEDVVDHQSQPNDLIQLFKNIAPLREDASRNETMKLFEQIHGKFPEFPKNLSHKTMQQFFSLLTFTPQENLKNRMLMQLVDSLIAGRNGSQQRKIVHDLFQDMMSRVSLSYNETMSKIVEDILRLHKKRRMFPMLDLIQRVLATNETEIGNIADNIKMYDAMNRRFPMKLSFQAFTRYLDNIQDFVDSENKQHEVLGVLEKIFPGSENAFRNDTLGLYRLITGAFHVPKFSKGPIEELISLLRNTSRIQSHQRILTSKAEDMLFLRFVDKLRIFKNASHQRSVLRHTFNDMVSRVSVRYNRTISSILEDILLLHENERMSPVVDFLQNIAASNESKIGNKQANLKMFEEINRLVPTHFQLPDFTRFLKDLQYFGEFRNEPRAPESEDSILISFLQNASYIPYLKPSKSNWVDYFYLIANTSVSETEDVIKTYDTLLKQSHKSTAFLTINQGTELINILKNITHGQWIHRDDSSWKRIYGSLKNASSASEGKRLNELIKHLFGEVLNETKVDLSDGILLDMIEDVRNKTLLTSDRVLHWMEVFRAIKKISLGQLRNTLGSLLEIMSRLDAVLEQPQPYPISDEEILRVFQNITELSISLQKSDSINSFNEMMHRMKQTEDELYPAVVKGNRRFLLQLDSLFNPEEFERKKREHVLLEFLLKIPRLLNASELDYGDLMALQQVNDLDYFDYSIYEERPLEDNRGKDTLNGFLGAMEKLVGVDLNVWNNSFPQFLGESPSTSQHGTSDLQRMYYSLAKGIRMMSKAFHGILTMLQTQSLTAESVPTTTIPETNDLDAFLNNIGNMSQIEAEPDLTLIQRFSKLTISVKNSTGSDLEDVIGVLSSLFAPQETDPWRLQNTDSIDQWSEWTAWSTCSTSCGHGEHVRRRACSITIEGLLIASDQCIGVAEEVSGCLVECHEGAWADWSSWSRCDNKCGVGNQTRSRSCGSNHMETIATPPVNHFCKGSSDEKKTCRDYDFDECSLHDIFVPGTWSEWSAWTNCPDVCKGHRERQRSCHPLNETMLAVTRMKRDEGLLCEGDPKQNISCLYSTECWKRMHPIITDAWTKWSQWSRCDNRCGVGNQTRSRQCRLTNQHETMATLQRNHSCYGASQEKRSCSEYDFDECTLHNIFVPGVWTEWSQWSSCSENCTGHRNRHRLCHPLNDQTPMVTRMKRDKGLLCEGNSTQNASCAYSIACWKRMHPVITAVWSEWSPWSQCDNRCGIGNQTRSRRCRLTSQRETMTTLHRNHFCQNGSEEKRSCSKYDFNECTLHHVFVPGTWTEWGQWSICSDKCTGHRNRHRVCHPLNEQTSVMTRMKRDKGLLCEGDSTQNDSCVSSDCEKSSNTSPITVIQDHRQVEEQGTSAPVIVTLSMIGFVLFVILIIWYFATSRRRRRKKPYRTERGNSAPSVFQSNGKRSSSEGSRSSSTRSIFSWRSKSKESALFSDQNSEESTRLLDNEEAPPVPSRFCPYTERSRSSTGDISAEWLWPWETEGDDWAGLDFEADNASQVNSDVYMEVNESAEEPQTSNDVPERVLSASDNRTEDDQDNKMVELEKSAEAWFD